MVEHLGTFQPKDLTVQGIKRFLSEHEIDQSGISRVRRLVSSGITLADHNPTTNVAVREVIAKGIYLPAKCLDILPPDSVGIIKGSSAEDGIDSSGETILAQSNKTSDFPNGYINFADAYLNWLASRIEGRTMVGSRYARPGYFLSATPHEMFHLYQITHFLEQIKKDQAATKDKGADAWNKTLTERNAVRFGTNFALAQELLMPILASDFSF